MDDLVERLRMAYRLEDDTDDLREEAAAEITRLRSALETARREALEEAWLTRFVRESNKIEGITRDPTQAEIDAHTVFLSMEHPSVHDVCDFVAVIAPGKPLRNKPGMNVQVGTHVPIEGGPHVEGMLQQILELARNGIFTPYEVHQRYEHLHPFMDGNGRSGRVLWLWMMQKRNSIWPEHLGFLRSWYYQSLEQGPTTSAS